MSLLYKRKLHIYSLNFVPLFFKVFCLSLYVFICLFVAVLGLHCCAWAFSSCSKWGSSSWCTDVLCCFSCGARALATRASVAAAHRLRSRGTRALVSVACGIFPAQGLPACFGRQTSHPLYHQGSPGPLSNALA